MLDATISYAQNREDLYLAAFFPNVEQGFYVDVGANHPENDSVTKYFYDRGWSGINIEPNERLYKLLETNRPKDKNIMVGISDTEKQLTFREYDNHGLSTFSKGMQKNYTHDKTAGTEKYVDREIKTISLGVLFSDQEVKRINFLKVDVEGYELEVLRSNDWKKYRPEVICIEANHADKVKCQSFLEQQHYQKVFFDGLNDYFLAEESKPRQKMFEQTYPSLLVGKPVLPHVWEGSLTHIDELNEQNAKLQSQLEKTDAQLRQATVQLRAFGGIRYSVKHLVGLLKNRFSK